MPASSRGAADVWDIRVIGGFKEFETLRCWYGVNNNGRSGKALA